MGCWGCLVLSPGLTIKHLPGTGVDGREGPLAWELCLQLPTLSQSPRVLSTLPSHLWGSPWECRVSPVVLSCCSSFYPWRDSLATSSAVQLPRFGSHFVLSLRSSKDLVSPAHVPCTLVCAQRGGHHPPDCQPTFRSQPASCPSPTCLPCPWSSCCHRCVTFGALIWASRVASGPLRPRQGAVCFPAGVSGVCCPLPSPA